MEPVTTAKTQSEPRVPTIPLSHRIVVTIEPGHVAQVDRVVQAVERCWRRWQAAQVPGVGMGQDGVLRFPVGLVPMLLRELARDGYRVDVHDLRSDNFEVDMALVGEMMGSDRRYSEALVHRSHGLIEVLDHSESIIRISQLRALFPQAQVVVAVPTRKVAWQIQQALSAVSHQPVALLTAHAQTLGHHCVVCSYAMLGRVVCPERSILVLVEAERAVQAVAASTSGSRPYSRVYGYVYAGVSRDAAAELRLTALAGEVLYATPTTTTPGRVLMIPAPSASMSPRGRGLQRKRQTIWKNRPRNRRVAQVARVFLDQDRDDLQECGIHLDANELQEVQRVVVLVESTAHARELRSLLPGWPLLDQVPEELKPSMARPTCQQTSTSLCLV